MLVKPFLAKCSDRTSMPKSHPTSGNPEDWLSSELLLEHELLGITFDFFVDWSANPNKITPTIWVKRILKSEFTYAEVVADLHNVLITEFGFEYLERLISFCTDCQLQMQLIIFRDDFDWVNPLSEILVVNLSNNNQQDLVDKHSIISIEIFKELIRNNSGGPVQIGSKALIYGTSSLECYLSGTNSLYPGDVDLILLDRSNKPAGILEFKKHTLDTPISKQRLKNYYPYPDGRKYNRLSILKDYLSNESNTVPFFVIYYPTNSECTEGRLELLQGAANNLSTKTASNFALPINNSHEEYSKMIDKLKKAIAYHYNQS